MGGLFKPLMITAVSTSGVDLTEFFYLKIFLYQHSNIFFFTFLGIFTSETRCLNCETVTSKDEDFFDLSIDVEQNTSITSCLKNFSNTETLCSDNKFQCDSCCTLQEAHVSIFFEKSF